jgi:RimJ/RimL family protein N-acetyltransferase
MTTTADQPGELQLRRAVLDDCQRIFDWRNDPLSRANSHHTGLLSPADHRAWYEAAVADPDRRIFIAQQGGLAVGMVRADRTGDGWRLSWIVAPEYRGRRLLAPMLALALGQLTGRIAADIRTSNAPSQRAAARVGFRQVRVEGDFGLWELNLP